MSSPAQRLRLFVAMDLPSGIESELREWQRRHIVPRPELRASRSLHVTLSFLGDTEATLVPAIAGRLAGVATAEVRVAFGEPVFLPERGRKAVVALALVDPSGALVRLQHDVSETLTELGVQRPERRPFLPHLTVARFRRPGHAFPLQNVNVEAFGLPSVILYSSALEKGGAVHTPLAAFPAR